jgi:hypothetical protein
MDFNAGKTDEGAAAEVLRRAEPGGTHLFKPLTRKT